MPACGPESFIIFNLKSKIKNLKSVRLVTLVLALTMCEAVAHAQQPAGIPRIGILIGSSASNYSARVEAFRRGLRELGYVEGQNLVIEQRHADDYYERLPALAQELLSWRPDVLLVSQTPAALAAKAASSSVPVLEPDLSPCTAPVKTEPGRAMIRSCWPALEARMAFGAPAMVPE